MRPIAGSHPARRLSARTVLARLRAKRNPANVAGMRRYGITSRSMLGVTVHDLRSLAGPIGTDHALALRLWRSGVFEARLLACIIDDPRAASREQLEEWARAFDSWALCDGCCQDLVAKTPFAWELAFEWSHRPEEFTRRAGFALVAKLAFHDRTAPDARFRRFLRVIERQSDDDRNYVRKAVNWALRAIGHRNPALHAAAVATAERLRRSKLPAARWIASDALRELRRPSARARSRPPASPPRGGPRRSAPRGRRPPRPYPRSS